MYTAIYPCVECGSDVELVYEEFTMEIFEVADTVMCDHCKRLEEAIARINPKMDPVLSAILKVH